MKLIETLTAGISTITDNYLSYDGECNDRREWVIEDISDRWCLKIPFRLDGTTPMILRATWFGKNDDCILHFEDTPTTEGAEHFVKWLRCMMELDF